jgi:hypothetical protein
MTTRESIGPDPDDDREPDARLTQQDPGAVNTEPGPTDQGGSGGMASREQAAHEAAAGDS